jgi:hypothetical protein
MEGNIWIAIVVGVLMIAAAALVWRPIRCAWREARFAEARRDFHRQRERLEAKFVQMGAVSARTDAPRWTDCQFDDDVAYARNRSTGELSALVAVTIEMENEGLGRGIESEVGSLRGATAVFRFDRDHWETDGRAIFNLTPTEAINFYHRDLEMVGQELAQQRS